LEFFEENLKLSSKAIEGSSARDCAAVVKYVTSRYHFGLKDALFILCACDKDPPVISCPKEVYLTSVGDGDRAVLSCSVSANPGDQLM